MFPLICKVSLKEMTRIALKNLTNLEQINNRKYDWIRNLFIKMASDIYLELCEEKLSCISSDRSHKPI